MVSSNLATTTRTRMWKWRQNRWPPNSLFSIETKKESTAKEKYSFNFRKANFDEMHDKLVILEQLIEGTDAAQLWLRDQSHRRQQSTYPRKRITISRPSQGDKELMKQENSTSLKNQMRNMPQQNAKWKELWDKQNVARK